MATDLKTDIEELESIFNRSILKLFKDQSVSYHSKWIEFEQNFRTAISQFVGSSGNDSMKSKFMLEMNTLFMQHSTYITNLETMYLEKCKTCLINRRQVLVAAQTEILRSLHNTPPSPPTKIRDSPIDSQPFSIGTQSINNDENTNNSNSNHSNHNISTPKESSIPRPFKCYYAECGRDYTTQAYLYDHIRQTHKGKPYKCDECNLRFSRKKEIEIHQREEHPRHEMKYKTEADYKKLQVTMEACPECDHTTSTLRSLCLHIRTKHKKLEQKLIEQKVFKVCKKCGQSYHCVQRHQCNRRNIKPHNFETAPRKSDESMQSKFDDVFLRRSMLSSSHEATTDEDIGSDEDTDMETEIEVQHSPDPERVYKCEYDDCSKAFAQRKYLAKHIRGVHKGCPYKCVQCEEKFEYERDLLRHQKECKVYCICRKPQNKQPMISCDYCPEWYHYDCVGLTRQKANSLREYKCEACRNAQYCICRKPDDGKGLIQCDACDEWYHYKCINYTTEQAEAIDEYICSRCLNDAESQDLSRSMVAFDEGPPRKKHRIESPL